MGETIYIVRSIGDRFDILTGFTVLDEAQKYATDERKFDNTVTIKSFEWYSGKEIT